MLNILTEIVINLVLGFVFVAAIVGGMAYDRYTRQYSNAESLATYTLRNQQQLRVTNNANNSHASHLIEPLSAEEWIKLVTRIPHRTYVKCQHRKVAVTVQFPSNRSLDLDWTSIVAFLQALNADVTTDAETLSWQYERKTLKTSNKVDRANQRVLLQVMQAVEKTAVNTGAKNS